ncbi:MAG: TRAP transporter permease DctM/Q [Rhodospirillaceae bacterium]|nr:TRAP transporter permease DctM/Q [Rhodospirillaceae bacterium]
MLMSEGSSKNIVQQAMGYIVVIVGLTMAITGILNSAPTFWIVPRVGPFPEELIRPIILAASIFIVLVRNPISVVVGKRIPGIARFAWIVDIAIMLASLWVFWHYYDVLMRIEEGLFDLEIFHPIVALTACSIFIVLCWRVWGAPLGICGIVAIFYLYTGEYWPWIFETAPIPFIESSEDLWFNLNDGILGTIMGILIFTVFPFILLGVLLEGTGGGRSLIKVAFHLTRRFRGGPAHAAILASSLFGTMSGGAVTNVVATGVLTIPMIKRRGFQPAFAGGVEATASSAGQIMPPIMGAAALVMADFTGISYLTIIVAALIPALAYYASLFTSVIFEARRLGIEAVPDMEEDLAVNAQDFINLIMVFVPIGIVILALLNGFSAAGSGLLALYTIVPLSFLNPEIRKKPYKILLALAKGGETFGHLLMAIGVVGIIVAVLGTTGLPNDFAQVLNQMAGAHLFPVLLIAGIAALMMGMGMPTLPAYLTIILIMGPSIQNLGISELVAHLFVLYYGVASSITPPVAVAAYAAASIAEAPPLRTAVFALRIGLVKFIVPFVFAFYPVLLLVEESGVKFDFMEFSSAIIRLLVVIYLVSSATLAFDQRRLPSWEVVLRLVLAFLILVTIVWVHWVAFGIAVLFLAWHYRSFAK